MNVESLLAKVDLFEDLIIKSGFKRDLEDYIQAIQQPQNRNLIFMKDLSLRIQGTLIEIKDNSLDSELSLLLKDTEPFTDLNTEERLNELDGNTEADASSYYQDFYDILSALFNTISRNEKEVNEIEAMFSKYITSTKNVETDDKYAIISVIFKDLESTTNLKEFSSVLNRWNQTLKIYHMLLKPGSPSDISLVEVQNGSIDVILSIDFDIAIDLVELIRLGLEVYGAYLLYKSKTAKELIESYRGNKKLIELEDLREKYMLDNIGESIVEKMKEQHNDALIQNPDIDSEGVDKKIERVSKVLTDHIIKGNEVKLLTISNQEEDPDGILQQKLRDETAVVQRNFKSLGLEDKRLLLEKYTYRDDSEN